MDRDEARLRELLAGEMDREKQDELESLIAERPSLRRKLADLALDTETAVLQIGSGPPVGEQGGDAGEAALGPDVVDMGRILGRGGMAVVRMGRQLRLDRPVAVKSLRPAARSPAAVAQLLHEARITGRIEHPNVVPVHDIVRGPDGLPQVVLKLIEGHTWARLMGDAERVRELFGATDLLEWNLGVLMSVARALSFAHSRNVLHRDVKPGNVMVGPFGEVYLVDWGIAHEIGEPGGDEEIADLSGTSGYMAPEQLRGDSAALGTWTDTYLLGATLYQILAGRPPHAGRPIIERRITGADEAAPPPPLPDDVPAELRRIVAEALEPDPQRRTARPEDLRLAVAEYLQHRGALRLAERGDQERARAAAASEAGDSAGWERAILAAELSYLAALEEWRECPAAAAGARALATLRIEQALASGDVQAAGRIVEAQDGLPDDLVRRVGIARDRAAEEAERLKRIVADADRRFGHRLRGIFGAAFGLIWVGFWCLVALYPPADVTLLVGFSGGFLAVGVAAVVGLAPQLLRNRINRASMWVVGSSLFLTIVWCLGAGWLGLEMRTVLAGFLLMCAFFTSGMAGLVDPWGAVSAVGFVAGFLLACYRPAWTPHAVVGSNVVLLVNQLVLNFARAKRGFEELPAVGQPPRANRSGPDTSPPG